MFYRMIEAGRDRWLASDACTVKGLLAYMEQAGRLRDAQVDAIRTYLYLKLGCGSRPLAELFCRGTFNNLALDELEVSSSVRAYLRANPAAAAL